MRSFGTGESRTPEYVESRFAAWSQRFAEGSPHGVLTVLNSDTHTIRAHAISGGGDRPCTSEMAYAMLPDQQGQGLGTKIVKAIVQEWAPEVRRIGLGQGLDPEKDIAIMHAFSCFGQQALEQLDATAHPKNIGFWRVLEKNGFEAATCDLDPILGTIDMSARGIETVDSLNDAILSLFQSTTDAPLKANTRYPLIDHEEKVRTVSFKEKFGSLRFHFEKKVE